MGGGGLFGCRLGGVFGSAQIFHIFEGDPPLPNFLLTYVYRLFTPVYPVGHTDTVSVY